MDQTTINTAHRYTTFRPDFYKEYGVGGKPVDGWNCRTVQYPDGCMGHVYKAETGRWVISKHPEKGTFNTRQAAAKYEWELAEKEWKEYEEQHAKPEPEKREAKVKPRTKAKAKPEPTVDPNICGIKRHGHEQTCTEGRGHKGVHRATTTNEAGEITARYYWGKA